MSSRTGSQSCWSSPGVARARPEPRPSSNGTPTPSATSGSPTCRRARLVTENGEELTATSGAADEPVDPGGFCRIGSDTEPLVATVVLQLVAEGRLTLDDTVEENLPGVVFGNGNDGRLVTARHLLQHTSGIHDDYPGFDTPEQYLEGRPDASALRGRPTGATAADRAT